MRPNLFSIATKELSQDAFIAWLLKWASPECEKFDAALSDCAKKFASKLLSLQIEPPSTITKVEAGRQLENIDVWAKINGKYLLIIEDKIFAGKHSNQLERYREWANAWCIKNNFQLVCVYLKTGSESNTILEEAKKQGFAVFMRRDFLEILNCSPVNNHIFSDFKERLQGMEDEENQFMQKPIKDWCDPDWRGFYQALEKKRFVKWEYVNNYNGGFWNAVLNWNELKDCCPYMQIEQGPLCFKVGEVYEKHSDLRNRYHNIFMAHCAGRGDIRRPDRFGAGTYMTIAVVDRTNWLGEDDSLVNLDKVVARLNEYEQLNFQMVTQLRNEINTTQHPL